MLVRTGQTEGSVDLCRLAGLRPASVICEIMKDDGTMARLADLEEFGEKYDLKICTIADLIQYRLKHDSLIHRVATTRLPTHYGGEFRAVVYNTHVDSTEHLALIKGEVSEDRETLVRVCTKFLPGDVFGFEFFDTGSVIKQSMELIAKEGAGVLLYLQPEGKGLRTAEAREARELPRLRHRCPDPAGPGGSQAPARHQQPQKPRGPVRLRPGNHQLRPLPHAPPAPSDGAPPGVDAAFTGGGHMPPIAILDFYVNVNRRCPAQRWKHATHREELEPTMSKTGSGDASFRLLTMESWERERRNFLQDDSNYDLPEKGDFDVEILCPLVTKEEYSIPLNAVTIEKDERRLGKHKLVKTSRKLITDAYFLSGYADQALTSRLGVHHPRKRLIRTQYRRILLTLRQIRTKAQLKRRSDTRAKMTDLLGQASGDFKDYKVQGGKIEQHPLPYAVRNILFHIGSNPNKLDPQGRELARSIELLRQWTQKP